ncbi:hypothetical protein, partial [Staphylococcus aureus]|uniref:hypothetical protein n=1 Tax=Staphylococcus aureus TaxID=1280 RepID=UPI002181E263
QVPQDDVLNQHIASITESVHAVQPLMHEELEAHPSRTIDDVRSVVTNYHQHYVKDDISIYGKGKKRQVPQDDVLNQHIASITESVHAVQPLMHEELEA